MLFRVTVRHLTLLVLLALLLKPYAADADLVGKNLNTGVVVVNAYRNKREQSVTGLVVQADRYNGYVLTNQSVVDKADTLTVTLPKSGAEFVAQVISVAPDIDLALLKVNGLDVPTPVFSSTRPEPGDVVWSAIRWPDAERVGLSRGNLTNTYRLQNPTSTEVISHSAIVGDGSPGSVLLNDCGEVIGFNMTFENPDANQRAVDGASLMRFLGLQNVQVTEASLPCVSAIEQAREKAELATEAADAARREAIEAQRVAKTMELQLKATDQRNQQLIEDAQGARETAEAAILAASAAQNHAEQTRIDLEKQTASLMAETEAMVALFQQDRDAAEARFQKALEAQRQSAVAREDFLITAFVALIVCLMLAAFVIQRLGIKPAAIVQAVQTRDISVLKPNGAMIQKPDHDEYVLDGRDEDGIRYLLRISGDQMGREDGIVIGRNPSDSPYIINHSDVSRQHARLKVMKNRVFIEDLGSTNGTSVNGQNIDDKGLVSVANGDQIIIGSVVMKLKVLGG